MIEEGPPAPKVLRMVYFVGAGCKLDRNSYRLVFWSTRSMILTMFDFGSFMYFRDQQMAWDGEKIKSETAGEESASRWRRFIASNSCRFGSESNEMMIFFLFSLLLWSRCKRWRNSSFIFDLKVCIFFYIFPEFLFSSDEPLCLSLNHLQLWYPDAKWESSFDFDFVYDLSTCLSTIWVLGFLVSQLQNSVSRQQD